PAWRDRSRPALLDLRPGGDRRSQARRIGEAVSKKRVHEIAKEHGLSSKELLEKLNAAGIEAKVAASSVEEAVALKALAGASAPASASHGAPAAPAPPPHPAAPPPPHPRAPGPPARAAGPPAPPKAPPPAGAAGAPAVSVPPTA